MSNVAKLKKQAAELELKKQFDKAIAVYVKLLESFDEYAEELDVALFNRVGDLMLRQGNVADAVDYYEKAVVHYSEGGFFNNAIALCNKILRHSPGRATIYYRLGKISAQKGFKTDAKQNFLEYADRMQKAGKMDEAFRALNEFADLCPDQDDIRLMLADQLSKLGRRGEAVEQLQTLHERYVSEGRDSEAAATAARMRTIDPKVKPRSGSTRRQSSGGDLVFIDLEEPLRLTPHATAAAVAPPPATSTPPRTAAPPRAAPPPPVVVTPPSPEPMIAEVPDVAEPIEEAEPETVVRRTPEVDSHPAISPIVASSAIEPIAIEPLGIEPDALEQLAIQSSAMDDVDFSLPASDLLLGLESSEIADAPNPHSTPAGGLVDLDPTVIESDMVSDPSPDFRVPTPAELIAQPEADPPADLDFILAEPELSPEAARGEGSIDFDLAADVQMDDAPVATPPAFRKRAPAVSRTPPRASPASAASLQGLPLIDAGEPPQPLGDVRVSFDEFAPVANDAADRDVAEDEEGGELVVFPTPSFAHRSTSIAMKSVEILKASVEASPEDWSLRRELAELMLEAGDRAGGIRELETAMAGAERSSNLDLASRLAEEIARLEPEVVRHHQKRVELAFRTNDRARLIEAYLSLGDALVLAEQSEKARTVYQRVIELAPDDARARAALDTIVVPEAPPPPPPTTRAKRISGIEPPRRATPAKGMAASNGAAGLGGEGSPADFVNLGDWLRDEQAPRDTRMVVEEQEPSGDEDADFADMLRKFKQGVAENVDPEDYQSHYDLAIAFKEMGLLDEAIAEFQKALSGAKNRLPTFEALGQCFLEKGQFKMASSILSRALSERDATEDKLVGVLYLLGRAAESMGQAEEALGFYQRVFVLDIQFRDITDRISDVERAAR